MSFFFFFTLGGEKERLREREVNTRVFSVGSWSFFEREKEGIKGGRESKASELFYRGREGRNEGKKEHDRFFFFSCRSKDKE